MADTESGRKDENDSLKSEIEKKSGSISNKANDADDRRERISLAGDGDGVRNRRHSRRCSASGEKEKAPGAGTGVSTRDFAQAFRQWMWQYQLWAQAQASLMYPFPMNYLPMTTPYMNMNPPQTFGGVAPPSVNSSIAGGQPFGPPLVVPGQQNAVNPPPILQGRECQLPALWKRIVAEFIDFFLLFIMKLSASLMVIEYIGVLDIEKYDLDQLLAQDWDSNIALSFTSDLIAMEIINRIFICLFETLCLRRGFAGSVGGTTPGKYFMRLRVVSCQSVVQLPGNKVLIIPGNDIGFWYAFLRSIIKNFSLVFFFPVCFTVFFFPNSRTAYDIVSCSIVVEVTRENVWAWPRRQN